MPFPTSFETVVVVERQHADNESAAQIAASLERAFVADGSAVTNSDGTYFEFRRPYFVGLVPALVGGGTIRTEPVGNSIEVRAEVNVRLAPGLLALLALTGFPWLVGARPMDSALSFLVSGGVIQFFYLKAVTSFSRYVDAVCRRIGTAFDDPSPTRKAR